MKQEKPESTDQTPALSQEEVFASLGFTAEQVAQHPDQITKGTKVYVGSLIHQDSNGKIIPIFDMLKGIEVYVSPDRKIRRQALEIDGRLAGKSVAQVVGEFNQAGIDVHEYAKDILRGVKFTGNPRVIELIWLTGYDLGCREVMINTRDIFEGGNALGLKRCDGEVGLYQRFTDQDQPMNTGYSIATDPIADSNGDPRVLLLTRGADGLGLDTYWAHPDSGWYPGYPFCFRFTQV